MQFLAVGHKLEIRTTEKRINLKNSKLFVKNNKPIPWIIRKMGSI